MATLQKEMTANTQDTAIKHVYNDVDKSLTVNGFLVSKVGAKVEVEYDSETVVFSFFDNDVMLYQITVVYTDSTRTDMVSAERTA